jgi:hypothetical protein
MEASTTAAAGADGVRNSVQPSPASALPDSIDKLSAGRKVTDEERLDALDWFLSDEDEDAEITHTLEINVGSATKDRWVEWVIQPIDSDELRRIQQLGQNRSQRRRGATPADPDMAETNRRIVIAGTVHPDLRDAAQRKGVADPSVALNHRFRHRPGVVAQIAGEILALSGNS